MEKDNKTEEKCCSKGGCGGHCGCGAKMILAVVLLLLGGIIGYLMGSHCGLHRGMGCPYSMSIPAPTK